MRNKIIFLLILFTFFIGCTNSNLFQKRKYLPRFKSDKPVFVVTKDSLEPTITKKSVSVSPLYKSEHKMARSTYKPNSTKFLEKIKPRFQKKQTNKTIFIVHNANSVERIINRFYC